MSGPCARTPHTPAHIDHRHIQAQTDSGCTLQHWHVPCSSRGMKTASLDHLIDSTWRVVRATDPAVREAAREELRPQAQKIVWNFEPELAKG